MCEHVKFPDGNTAIICGMRTGRKWCVTCNRPAGILCDWKVPGRNAGTCDAAVCAHHAKQVAPGKHLCPEHQRAFDFWRRRHPDVDDAELHRRAQDPDGPRQESLFQGVEP